MRFEVLIRDAEIACWKAVAAGADDCGQRAELERTWHELDAEFAFVGGEAMSGADAERVRRIAGRPWMRTLDDRIGLSQDERKRLADRPPAALPALERLLDDKPEHRIPRDPGVALADDNPWGFRLRPPIHRFDRGEATT